MKQLLVILALAFLASAQDLHAQKVNFTGTVQDSLSKPVEFANVMAIDSVTNTIATFGVTNAEGRFKLPLEPQKTYLVKVSFVGFENFETFITTGDSDPPRETITLKPSVQQLDAVEVVQEMPVTISGDTITYKTDAFTTGEERKLGDVLEALPGFEVDDNGEVKVQGKKVDKLMVEGKEFFNGDTKLATKNLPANAVDKVQLLQDFNEVSPMSGLGNEESLALNIQLKEGKKSMVFGDLSIGGGPEDRYRAHANTFYYDEKTNINFIGDANNIGELAFSMNDYFRFNGGFASLGRRSGSSFNISSDNIGIPMAERNSAQRLDNKLAAFNYNYTPNKKWRFSGFAIGSLVDNGFGSVSQRTYLNQGGDNQELLVSESRVENTSGLFKFTGKYTPNPSLQIDYSAFLKASDMLNSDRRTSTFSSAVNQIQNSTSQQPLSLQQQVQAFYAKDAMNVFSFQATYEYKRQNPLFDLMTTQRPFNTLVPVLNGNVYNLLQAKEVITNKQEASFNYYRILNNTNHVNFSIGNSYSSQRLVSGLTQRQESGADVPFNQPELNNDVDFEFSDIFAGIRYKTKLKNLILSPGINVHRYNFSNLQSDTRERIEKTLVLPELYAKYNFRRSHSLTLNYSVQAEFTDVQNVATGLVVQNYNSVFQGNRALENSWYHNVSMNYTNFNMFSSLNIFGNLNYQKRYDGITNAVRFSTLDRISSPLNIGVANEMISGSTTVDKRFNTFRIKGTARLSQSNNNNLVNNQPNENRTFTQEYTGSIETTLLSTLNIELGYAKIYNRYTSNVIKNLFVTDRPYGNLNVSFLKGFRFDLNYEYNSYKNDNTGIGQQYDIMNAELSYRKTKSKWEFKLSALNVLNTTSIRRDSFNESLISTYEFFIQKRYFILGLMYDL